MTKQIEFVFLDIDGTIFHNNEIVESAYVAISELKRKNIPVALCTGRSVLHTSRVQEQLDISGGVYFNGGLVQYQGATLYSTPLFTDVVERIIDFTERHQLPLIMHTSEEAIIMKDIPDEYLPILKRFDFPPLELVERSDWKRHPDGVYQANVLMDPSWEQVIQNEIPECLIYRWDERAVDLQRRGSDKSLGAIELLKHLGIKPENAMHIGDGGNDIGMFRRMGLGIAMGNAPDEVKHEANMVTRPVNQDGVYYALKHIGLI